MERLRAFRKIANQHIGFVVCDKDSTIVAIVKPRNREGERRNEMARAAAPADTPLIYMGAGDAIGVTRALSHAGLPLSTPVSFVESASRPDAVVQRGILAALPGLAAARGNGPALIVVGQVCAGAVASQPAAAARVAAG
jgi:siroheme synthase